VRRAPPIDRSIGIVGKETFWRRTRDGLAAVEDQRLARTLTRDHLTSLRWATTTRLGELVTRTRLDFSVFDSPFPHSLFIPQKTTEEIIDARAHELCVVHKTGHEVDALGQDAEGIFVEGSSDEGRFRLAGRYLVGCDGARSVTRRLLNIGFPGLDSTHAWLMGDVKVDLPEGKLMLSEFNGNGSAMIAPLGDGVRSRIIVATPDEADLSILKVTPTLNDLTRMTKKVLGTDFNARDPIWISRFTNETRLADPRTAALGRDQLRRPSSLPPEGRSH
jgi:2-polyprenyl-6-methoxyphenol hydroxylase-like FAD-dependent oxidoreductase